MHIHTYTRRDTDYVHNWYNASINFIANHWKALARTSLTVCKQTAIVSWWERKRQRERERDRQTETKEREKRKYKCNMHTISAPHKTKYIYIYTYTHIPLNALLIISIPISSNTVRCEAYLGVVPTNKPSFSSLKQSWDLYVYVWVRVYVCVCWYNVSGYLEWKIYTWTRICTYTYIYTCTHMHTYTYQ